MPNVDASFALWLQADALYTRADDATAAARWGELARESTIASPLATKAGADAEAARQIAFLSLPLARDAHVVPGLHADKLGRVVTLSGVGLGYETPRDAFVIGAEQDRGANLTRLTVLRRLT